MAGDSGESVAFILDVLNLLKPNDWDSQLVSKERVSDRCDAILSVLRKIFNANTF